MNPIDTSSSRQHCYGYLPSGSRHYCSADRIPSYDRESTQKSMRREDSEQCIKYPGKPAKFVHIEDFEYKPIGFCTLLMKFKSVTEGSFIKSFKLRGYADNSACLMIKCQKSEQGDKYLKYRNLIRIGKRVNSCNQRELKTLYEILDKNNEIPEPYDEMIQNIIKKATPTKEFRLIDNKIYEVEIFPEHL